MGDEQVVLAHDERGGVEAGELEAVAVGDGVGGAGLDTVTAEDAAVVVDVVDLGVALGGGDADLFGVLGGLDVDAVRGAGGGAEEAGDTLFQAVFVALELVLAAEALLELGAAHGAFAVGIVFYLGRLEHLPEGDAHTLGDGGCVFDDRHGLSIRRRRGRLKGMTILRCSSLVVAGCWSGDVDACVLFRAGCASEGVCAALDEFDADGGWQGYGVVGCGFAGDAAEERDCA